MPFDHSLSSTDPVLKVNSTPPENTQRQKISDLASCGQWSQTNGDLSAALETSLENPLLGQEYKIPFDKIRAEHIEPAIGQLLAEAQSNIEAICSLSGPRTFENTMLALEAAAERLRRAMSVVTHLKSVASSKELRDAFDRVEGPLSDFDTSILLNERLWTAIRDFAASDEAQRLAGTKARLLTKTVESFKREGANLNADDKEKLRTLNLAIQRLTTKFSNNLLDSTAAFELVIKDEARLAGLPESAITAAKASAQKKGIEDGWRFTLQGPSYVAVMNYLDDRDTREAIYKAYFARASQGEHNNRPIIEEILTLRQEKARLLGFDNFANLILSDRMAGNGKTAINFIDDLSRKVVDQMKRETAALLQFRRDLEGPNAPDLAPWDVGYYEEKMRQGQYNFDAEQLRPYFSLDGAVSGMFELVKRLYGINVQEVHNLPVWHEGVCSYAIYDENGTHLGCFYSDLFPREEKEQGAWMDQLVTGGPGEQGFVPHLGLICGNFNPPLTGQPALLTHREVMTLFHEFGHLLHLCLSTVEIKSLAGVNVAWDFVELPSKVMENWCWEPECLNLFAKHYETEEVIPHDLLEKMRAARNFRSASSYMRQLGLSALDLKLHTEYSPDKDGSVFDYCRKEFAPFLPAPPPPEYAMIAGFSHLFSDPVGYAAAYYSYAWAEVLDADVFTRFKEKGIFDREVGQELRETIISKGNSADAMELFKAFMRREPDGDALLVRAGLQSS